MNYSFGVFFMMMHFIFLFFSFSISKSISFMFSFDLFEYMGEMYNLVFVFDWVSFLFLSAVSLISSVVMFYSIFYMGVLSSSRFFILLLLFVISMFFLIFSGNLIFMMLGWDGLGVVSFALVIYYQNEVSLKSGLITIFINRLGDAAMIFFICLYFSYSMNYFLLGLEDNWNLGVFLFLLGCFTKSAQFPFMSWLPAAMTAPTPISSLVHSSTLVTAGVYLLIRMNLFFCVDELYMLSKVLGLITMGSGGIMALMEFDFKKIVAFSTLSQLGLMIFVLSYGEWQLSFFHLLTHAIFKSFLFMIVGCVMTMGYGNQDGRLMGISVSNSWIINIFIGFACLNLSGFPLTMGFLSKDVILESFMTFSNDMIMIFIFCLCCCLTVAYSMKIYFMSVFSMKMGNSLVFNYSFDGSILGLFFLFFFLSFWGLMLEELVIFDDMFTGDQDAKIVDFLIIFVGLIFWIIFSNYFKQNLFYLMVDFFWFGWFYFLLSFMYSNLSLFLNSMTFYFSSFFSVNMFSWEYTKNNYFSNMNESGVSFLNVSMSNFLIMSFLLLNLFYFVFFYCLY